MNPAIHDTGRPGLMHLFAPYWGSRQRWRAWMLLALWLAITFGSTWLYVRANELTGELTDALLSRKWDVLQRVVWLTIGVGVLVGALGVVRTSLIELIDLDWRTWLTGMVDTHQTGDMAGGLRVERVFRFDDGLAQVADDRR